MPDDIYNNDSGGSRGKYESDLQSFIYSVNRKEQIFVLSILCTKRSVQNCVLYTKELQIYVKEIRFQEAGCV